jgi:acyl-CoA reductase-like NAD-dependent aldehyde dehydrogenase
MTSKSLELVETAAFIDGLWIEADATFEVLNPADGSVIARSPTSARETKVAIEAAHRAFPAWAAKTAKERGAILRKWSDLMLAHADDLARLMTAEQGKPLAESKGEVAYGAAFIDWFADEAKRAYGHTIPTPDARQAPGVDQAAGRRLRGHRAVELPDRHDHPQGRPGPGRRLHGGGQAGRRDAAVRPGHRPAGGRGGRAGRAC